MWISIFELVIIIHYWFSLLAYSSLVLFSASSSQCENRLTDNHNENSLHLHIFRLGGNRKQLELTQVNVENEKTAYSVWTHAIPLPEPLGSTDIYMCRICFQMAHTSTILHMDYILDRIWPFWEFWDSWPIMLGLRHCQREQQEALGRQKVESFPTTFAHTLPA